MSGAQRSRRTYLPYIYVILCFVMAGVGFVAPVDAADGRPVIGLLTKVAPIPAKLAPYVAAIASNGGDVVPIALGSDATRLELCISRIDGLLIPGGDDVDPILYGERNHPKLETVDRAFDDFEMAAFRLARARGLPVLGICRGEQLINVVMGGSLVQDLPSRAQDQASRGVGPSCRPGPARPAVRHRMQKGQGTTHWVTHAVGSRIGMLLGARRFETNSFHHQAVKRLAPGLTLTGWSDDGTVESFEGPADGPWLLAVQWHPEKMRPATDSLFRAFIEAALRGPKP